MALTGYGKEIQKIAQLDSGGLAAVSNSLAYRIGEIERHFHSYERWFGAAASVSGTHFADRIAKDIIAFEIDAGTDAYGTWVQLFGTDDTTQKYDLHKLFFTYAERAAQIHFVQIGFGTSGAQAITDGTYTEFVYRSGAATAREAPFEFQTRRQNAGTEAWARVLAAEADTAKLQFYIGIHSYEG